MNGIRFHASLAALALVLLAALPLGTAWAQDDAALREQLRKLQRIKAKGPWQDYTDLRIAIGPSADAHLIEMAYRAGHGEIRMTSPGDAGATVDQFVIPLGVYMSKGLPRAYADAPDTVEYVGLQGQLILFFLGQAFPDGPAKVNQAKTRRVEEKAATHEVRFLGGQINLRPAWRADVTVERVSDARIDFTVTFHSLDAGGGESFARGTWEKGPEPWVLPDAEPLEGWIANYFGLHRRGPGGEHLFDAHVGDTEGFTTVGDIRRAVRKAGKL